MPFRTEMEFPARPPDVQVFFHGLLMLIPDEDGRFCRIGVHRLSIQHKLSVEVRIKGTGPPDPPLLRLSGPLDSTGLTIKIFPETKDGVKKFVKDSSDDFDRSDASNHENDFRWCVDLKKLEGIPEFEIDKAGISPSIFVNDGLFHAATLTDPAKLEVTLVHPPAPIKPLHRVARIIGANIYLQPGQKVVLDWFAEGEMKHLDLPKTETGETALIYIDNSPSLMPSGNPDHSEFIEYFKVTNVDVPFDLKFAEASPQALSSGTDRAPCLSVPVGG